MRHINPLGCISSLVLDDGETLIDSAAILDWLDQAVGPERALIPAGGRERRRALGRIALATGVIDEAGAAAYEQLIRPSAYRWQDWIERCLTQATGAIEALAGGRRGLADGRPVRPGTGHDSVHDPLPADRQSYSDYAGSFIRPSMRYPRGARRGMNSKQPVLPSTTCRKTVTDVVSDHAERSPHRSSPTARSAGSA